MVLNNVTKFHKILIKSIRLREQTSFGQTYGSTYGRMDRGNTLVSLFSLIFCLGFTALQDHFVYYEISKTVIMGIK